MPDQPAPAPHVHLHRETFVIRANEVDAQRRLTLPALVNYLQEVANNNVRLAGMSVYDLHARGLAWVLARMRLEVFEYPHHGQEVVVKTFPSAVDKYQFYRDFRVYGPAGQLLAQATSTWPVIDLAKRQIVSVPDFLRVFTFGGDEAPLPVASGKLAPVAAPQHQRQFEVGWYDMDVNAHANNMCYFRWLVEAMPADFLAAHRLAQVDLQFRAEANLDSLIVVRTGLGATALDFMHQLVNPAGGKDYALARSVWALA
jgi:medium-chain acyl-[acyl-carrier-protein] hydrolase